MMAAKRRFLIRLICATLLGAGLLWWAGDGAGAAATAPVADEEPDGEREGVYTLLNEQLLLIATIVGAVATLPTLIEFLVDRRKRREGIALSLDDVEVETLNPRLAGLSDLQEDIEDLIDRARNPQNYAQVTVGNEVLILGPSLSGKKTFAQWVAKAARMERLITIYNPRNPDALAKAKSLVHSYRRQKVMLLLPRIDAAFEKEDEELMSEVEALIETTTEQQNVLVVGTSTTLVPDSPLDNSFGIKLVMPGTPVSPPTERIVNPEVKRVLTEVVRFYLKQAEGSGFALEGMTGEYVEARILDAASNPAEIEDIVSMCRTIAIYDQRRGQRPGLSITPEVLETAIGRVIVGRVPGEAEQEMEGELVE